MVFQYKNNAARDKVISSLMTIMGNNDLYGQPPTKAGFTCRRQSEGAAGHPANETASHWQLLAPPLDDNLAAHMSGLESRPAHSR